MIRRATEDDYRAFHSTEPPLGWAGFCFERDGRVVAFASVWIDEHTGKAWAGIDNAQEVPPIMLHRNIRGMLGAMAAAGLPAVHALCDFRIPRAEAWLRRLGFFVDTSMPQVYIAGCYVPVWTKKLCG